MTRPALVTRAFEPALYLAAVLPLIWIGFSLGTGRVPGDQVKFIQHVTGTTVLVALFLTLSVTPLRRLSGWHELVRIRRLLGLTAFWFALTHFLTYAVFDQSPSLDDIAIDVVQHPWVLVGFGSFLLLVPLAATSTRGWIRRLGGRRWQQLHRLVYPVAVGGVLHYLWLVKRDVRDPVYFAVILGVTLTARVWVSRRHLPPAREGAPVRRAKPATVLPAGGPLGY